MRRSAAVLAVTVFLAGCSESRQRSSTPTISQPPAIRVSGPPDTIPAGTNLEVRTNEAITSSSGEGRTYSGQIETDIRGSNGDLLVPKGSPVELVVLEAREKSGVRGPAVQLGLRSVTVNGATHLVVSQELEQTSGLGRNRRTAEMVGGGAALGTLIGAAAGGGKGAVLGGLVGAAAGAAAQVRTEGSEVKIPAETVLHFRLDEPIRLQRQTP
jgi:hypothetical protein